MQLVRKVTSRRMLVVPLALLICAIASVSTSSAIESVAFQVKGPGVDHPGRELSVVFSATNAAIDPAKTPAVIDRLTVLSRAIRFNGDSDSVATCDSALPKNGDAASCPKSSQVGSGEVAGILGTPGQAVDMFGPLSYVSGKFKLYNYKHPRGAPARMVAVIKATEPFRGVAINLVIPVSSSGAVLIDVPRLSKLPPIIRRSYPRGTKVVLSKLSASIVSPHRKHSKPFLSRRTSGQLDWEMSVKGG